MNKPTSPPSSNPFPQKGVLKVNEIDRLTEKELISACKKGDAAAQQLLYRRYSPMLFGLCLRYASTKEEAEDFLQEGFIKIYTNLYKYRPIGSFKGWMTRLVINIALEQLRKKKRKASHTSLEYAANIVSDRINVFDEFGQQAVLKMVQQLPDGYRAVFNMYVIEGYSHAEIAEMLGVSESTSKSQLSRAKSFLRKLIEKVV